MESLFFPIGSSSVHYIRAGFGETLIFCFHGYGESAASFKFLADRLPDAYTLIAIDLPYHGQTTWKESGPLDPQKMVNMLADLEPGPKTRKAKKILLGFSMGARVALTILEYIPDQIQKVLLLSPDGLVMTTSYWLANHTRLGRRLFTMTVRHPAWLFAFIQVSKSLGLLDRSLAAFTARHVKDLEARKQLLDRWTVLRKCHPRRQKIIRLVCAYQIKLLFIFGHFDRITSYKTGENYIKGMRSNCQIVIKPGGHGVLQENNIDLILQLIIQ